MDTRVWKTEQLRLLRHCQLVENGQLSLAAREGEFSSDQREFARSREVTLDIIKKRLTAFKMGLKNVHERLKGAKEGGSSMYNPADLQKYLESFEGKLAAYKSTMRAEFDGLASEELKLDLEVQSAFTKIDEWEVCDLAKPDAREQLSSQREGTSRARVADRYEKHMELQGKIGIIDRQLATLGGRYGGWESRDHDIFLRAWVQCTSTSSSAGSAALSDKEQRMLLKRLVATVALKTEEECRAHMDWYAQFSELSHHKKTLLEEWKSSRQRETAKKYKSTLDDSFSVHSNGSEEVGVGGGAIRAEDKEALRLRIVSWKREKEEEQRLQAAAAKEAALEEAARREHDSRKRQQQARLRLDLWKKEEVGVSETLKKTENVVKSTGRVTSADLSVRQQRDRELTQLQLARKEAAQGKFTARETKVRELAQAMQVDGAGVTASRDPKRLAGATMAFLQHKNDAETRADAAERRATTSAHRAPMAGSGRDLHGQGRQAAGWMSMK